MERARLEGLLSEWRSDAEQAQAGHATAADYFGRLDLWIGGAAAALAAVIGTSVFATLGRPLPTAIRVAAALVTFAAAALSGLQTFFKAAARAEAHRQASRRYGAVVRAIEQLETDPPADTNESERELDAVRSGLDDAGRQAPNVPPRIWHRVEGMPAG